LYISAADNVNFIFEIVLIYFLEWSQENFLTTTVERVLGEQQEIFTQKHAQHTYSLFFSW
jgi:hypothetical protein